MINLYLLLLALILANTPWLTSRMFFVMPVKNQKSVAWCLLELVVFYSALGLLARYAEHVTMGQVASQKWEFYVITFCLFLVLAFPGFIYRFFWKK
jgi:Na+(H+)/acetate symporter ActP